MPLAVIGGYIVCLALLARWARESLAHRRRINKLDFRIHVNGIRGKSTVTRIIAGLLREGGVVTVAKSTGTAAAVINREGVDEPIDRKAAPTILEQIEVTKEYVHGEVRALVIECMALKPQYQAVSEKMIVRSNIGVLTNVREDHQDVMGETLPEIARSLLSTCPYNGVLVTSERNPEIVPIMEEVAAKRGSRLIVADPEWVTDEELEKFDYIAFKENVAIALAVAELAGIPRDVAFRGMWAADPDPGELGDGQSNRDVLLERDVVELVQFLVGDPLGVGNDQPAAALCGDLLHDRHDRRIAFGGDQHTVVGARVEQ